MNEEQRIFFVIIPIYVRFTYFSLKYEKLNIPINKRTNFDTYWEVYDFRHVLCMCILFYYTFPVDLTDLLVYYMIERKEQMTYYPFETVRLLVCSMQTIKSTNFSVLFVKISFLNMIQYRRYQYRKQIKVYVENT